MYKRDYILTLIEQFGLFLARIVFMKQMKRYDEAQQKIDEAAKGYFGLDMGSIESMTLDELIAELDASGFDVRHAVALAELLGQQCDVSRYKQEHEKRLHCFALAYGLLDECESRDEAAAKANNVSGKMEELVAIIQELPIPVDALARMVSRTAEAGRFAHAYELFTDARSSGTRGLWTLKESFLKGLMSRSDEELQAGGMPRTQLVEEWDHVYNEIGFRYGVMRHKASDGSETFAIHEVYLRFRDDGLDTYTQDAFSPRMPSVIELKHALEALLRQPGETVICGDLGYEYDKVDVEEMLEAIDGPVYDYDEGPPGPTRADSEEHR